MSNEQRTGVDRRSFMKAAGTVAGASLLGVGTATSVEGGSLDPAFANWRVREARKVWARGFTGRHDRTIGLTDTGLEARHPDLGPWNGVTAVEGDSGLELKGVSSETKEVEVTEPERIDGTEFSGQTAPGGGAVGFGSTTASFTLPAETEQVSATLSWNVDNPDVQANDADFTLYDADGNAVATSGSGGTETQQHPEEHIETTDVVGGASYYFEVICWRGAVNWTITVDYEKLEPTGETETREVTTTSPFDGDVFGDASDKTVGWFDAGPRFGNYVKPRDGNGHGTHCSSIMGGTGRASTVDESALIQEDPHATLLPTDFLDYEVDVDAAGGVFAAAYGDAIELEIEGPDGRTIETGGIHADHSLFDNNLIDHPAVHSSGVRTYTVYVKPNRDPDTGIRGVGTVERVAIGPLLAPDEAGDGSRDGETTVHAGMAPNAGLVGLQGFGEPTKALGEHGEDFASLFNLRTVNMSWGYQGGAPIGAFGGLVGSTAFGENLPQRLKQIANAGILPIAAAGNSFTPANGNGDPAVADEAISVVATDPVDGLTSYSSGGVGGLDEEGVSTGDEPDGGDSQTYRKPDVSAPGGAADGYPAGGFDLVRASKNGDPSASEGDQPPIRDYTLKAGTSMASPYVTGMTGLLAEAMEFAAPSAIALPEPEQTEYEDVMRLKQVILATASETAFTAAPFHHPSHRPTYQFGDRDPYEGYGRVNPDAAVDAVSRNLLPGTMQLGPEESVARSDVGDVREVLGLNVPEDSRAVAGHVLAHEGTVEANVAFSHFAGGNKDLAEGDPHVDLFVYDAEAPAGNGEPNAVASVQATEGVASLSLGVGEDDADVYYVVAKLVNVPGAFNTHDVQVHLDLDVSFTATSLPPFTAAGSRADDGAAFTAGQTDQIDVEITDFPEGVDEVQVRDNIPSSWTHEGGDGDSAGLDENGRRIIDLGTVKRTEVDGDLSVEFSYFAGAPETSGQYELGPASAEIVGDASDFDNAVAEFGGTDTNTVVGVSTNTGETASSTTDETSTTGDAGDPVTSTTDSLL